MRKYITRAASVSEIALCVALFVGGCASNPKPEIKPDGLGDQFMTELENDPSIEVRETKPGEVVFPKLLKTVEPAYPVGVDNSLSAVVKVSALIEDTGEVSAVDILESSDHRFDESAVTAVKQYRFEPARYLGTPVVMPVKFEVKFRPHN